MLSSISSSELTTSDRRTRRSIGLILLGIVVIGLACEVASNYGFHRVSKIQGRIDREYHDSAVLPAYGPTGKPTMLMFGNSLLLEAVDYPQLKNDLADEYDLHRLIFEQTEYLDQYYALRTLFRHGARPRFVVICTSVIHLIGDGTRGEFMARYLDATDIVSLGVRQHLGPTTVSSQLFAHTSGWFANRAEIRKAVLSTAMPDVQTLTTVLAWRYAPPVSENEVRLKAEPRLRELKELCDRYETRLVVVVAPSLRHDHAEIVVSSGESLGIPILIPEPVEVMSPSMFRDGLHLTPAAAQDFTAKLKPQLAGLRHGSDPAIRAGR